MVWRHLVKQAGRFGIFGLVAVLGVVVLAACVERGAMPRESPTAESPPVPTISPETSPATATPRPAPATPRASPAIPTVGELVQQTLAGAPLSPNGWTVGGVIVSFRVSGQVGATLIPQVEVARAGQTFRGSPSATGDVLTARGTDLQAKVILKGWPPGEYRWQARVEDAETKRPGPWVSFANGEAGFGVAGSAPTIENLALVGGRRGADGVPLVGQLDHPRLAWSAVATPASALDYFWFVANHEPESPARLPSGGTRLEAGTRSLPLPPLDDGIWYLHLWAIDKAGQVGPPATLAVSVARTPPLALDVVYRSWATNPLYQTAPIRFRLSRSATVDLTILPSTSAETVRTYHLGRQPSGQVVHLAWDGKDNQGRIVPVGSYRFFLDLVDDAGNHSQAVYGGLTITNKVIRVSLGKQVLTAYEGDKLFLTTLVTSGGSDLPTPTGTFEILSKEAPFVFHSPFPKGSKFWYPDTTSNFAMLFDQADADFIHDAPWRAKFGPGTNGPGVPGQVYTGSHGCVETATDVMARLYPWTPLGAPVIITQ